MHLAMNRILTLTQLLVVIGTDCTGSLEGMVLGYLIWCVHVDTVYIVIPSFSDSAYKKI